MLSAAAKAASRAMCSTSGSSNSSNDSRATEATAPRPTAVHVLSYTLGCAVPGLQRLAAIFMLAACGCCQLLLCTLKFIAEHHAHLALLTCVSTRSQ
jgi:hypothetical protein